MTRSVRGVATFSICQFQWLVPSSPLLRPLAEVLFALQRQSLIEIIFKFLQLSPNFYY